MSATPMPSLAFVELEQIGSVSEEPRQLELLRDWERRWVIPVKDTGVQHILALMREHPGKYLGVGTEDFEATQRELTAFADHLGFRMELASVPRSETSFVVYFRRKMEQPQ